MCITVQCGLVAAICPLRQNSSGVKVKKSLTPIGYRRIQMTDGNEVSIEVLASAGKGNDRSCDYNNPLICEKILN